MISLEGKTAFITGAARGMGAGISEVFAECGAQVVMTDVDELVFETAEKIGSPLTDVRLMDVSDETLVRETVGAVLGKYGRIDILVNDAGVMIPMDLCDMRREILDIHYHINVCGLWHCVAAVYPQMKENGWGRIINLSSVTGPKVADPGMTAYAMSKGAVLAMTKAIAVEAAPFGITANAIMPGYIRTNMVQKTANAAEPEDPEKFFAKVSSGIPMGRMGTGREVGELAAFLASDAAGYITGAEIVIDGGHSLPETLALTGPFAPPN